MKSGIQDVPLSIPGIFHRAETQFARKQIYSLIEHGDTSISYAGWAIRVRQLIAGLDALKISVGESVATFCWNTQAHLELYYALPCSGRVIHPVNVRLFREELEYVIRDAPDVAIFVDRSLVETCIPAVTGVPEIRHIVVIDDGSGAPIPDDDRIIDYETLLQSQDPRLGGLVVGDETSAAALWHTSGTTGRPKGVVYSHRAVVLHALSLLTTDSLGLGEKDTVMPVVPMFHVGAWGTPYGALFAGSNLVLVGRDLRGEVLAAALERRGVTVSLAVPAVWRSMLPYVTGRDLSELRLPLCGGSSASAELITEWDTLTSTTMVHAWGMTETGPVTTVSKVRSYHHGASADEIMHVRTSQGSPVPLVEARIADIATGELLASDGVATGELQVRGPWIAGGYHGASISTESFTPDGWLRTGDIGTIEPDGYIRLVDRAKDMIKSGGEWISSVDLENAIMAHPLVLEAAVIGIPDERWDERPLACIVVKPGASLEIQDLLTFLGDRVVRWWLPDKVSFMESLPKTGVGKFSKGTLREMYARGELTSDSKRL